MATEKNAASSASDIPKAFQDAKFLATKASKCSGSSAAAQTAHINADRAVKVKIM